MSTIITIIIGGYNRIRKNLPDNCKATFDFMVRIMLHDQVSSYPKYCILELVYGKLINLMLLWV